MESGADRASELRALSGSVSTARRRQRNLNSLAWGVLVAACLLSLWAGATAWRQARDHARAQFDARADAIATAVSTHMNAYEDTVRAAVEEARFSQIVGKMQEAKAAQMDTRDVPAVVKLASKEFHITDSESTGVLQRLIESNDLTLYGLSNAVPRHSQDVESYDRASELESIGYSILTMPTQQWSRINRAAA